MPSTTTPNMNLIVPTVGQEPGPNWASDLNSDLSILDQHNHTSGNGVQITPAGIDINSDLVFNGNNATLLQTTRFKALSTSLPGISPNLGCLYVAGNELYYNDEAGNVVAITKNGSVNAGAGSITGLPSGTASASYSGGTFIFQQATNTAADLDAGSIILRNTTASSKGLTLNPPNAMASNYSLTLPSIPGSLSVLAIDTSGNIGQVTGTVAAVGANNIVSSVTRTTGSNVGLRGVAVSSSSGTFSTNSTSAVLVTNLSVTITTSGRPVQVALSSDGSANYSFISISGNQSTQTAFFNISNGTPVFFYEVGIASSGAGIGIPQYIVPSSSISFLDTTVNGSPGTYTYSVMVAINSGSFVSVYYTVLTAYEIT